MTIRLTPSGAIVSRYSDTARKWTTTKGLTISDLTHDIEFQPGLTIADIFKIVEKSPDVKALLEKLCYLDFEAIKARPPTHFDAVTVHTGRMTSDGPQITGEITADYLRLERRLELFEEDEEQFAFEFFQMMFRAKADDFCGVSFSGTSYADVKDWEIVLDQHIDVADENELLRTASIRHSALPVLQAFFNHFGDPPAYDGWTQRSIDETEAMHEHVQALRLAEDAGDCGDDEIEPDDVVVSHSVQEAQTQLLDLIHRLVPGDECVITENNLPVAKLVLTPVPISKMPRQLGTLRGTVLSMAPDFDAPLEDFKEYME